MNAGDLAMEKNDFDTANSEYSAAQRSAPDLVEIQFWCAVTLVNGGKLDEALTIFKNVFGHEVTWARLISQLAESGMLVNDPTTIKKILATVPATEL
jgi:predicted Zn-dependent protease